MAMGRKPRRNKSACKPLKSITGPTTKATPSRASGSDEPLRTAKEILARAKLGRVEEHVILQGLFKRHGYDLPARDLFALRAIRLQAVTAG